MSDSSDCNSNCSSGSYKRRLSQIDDTIENLTQEVNSLNKFVYETELEFSLMSVRMKTEKLKALSAVAKAQVITTDMKLLVAEREIYMDVERLKILKKMRMDREEGASQLHSGHMPTPSATATTSGQTSRGTSEKKKILRHSCSRKSPADHSSSRKSRADHSSSRKSRADHSSSSKSPADNSSSSKSPADNSSSRKSPADNSSSKKSPADNSLSRKSPADNSCSSWKSSVDIFSEDIIVMIPRKNEGTTSLIEKPHTSVSLGSCNKPPTKRSGSDVSISSSVVAEFNDSFTLSQNDEIAQKSLAKKQKSDKKGVSQTKSNHSQSNSLKGNSKQIIQPSPKTAVELLQTPQTLSKDTESSSDTVCTPPNRPQDKASTASATCHMPVRHKNLPQFIYQPSTSAMSQTIYSNSLKTSNK